jgi:hypothetical protein
MERVSSPKIADENIFFEQQRDPTDVRIPLPMTESEFLSRRASGQIITESFAPNKVPNDAGSTADDISDIRRCEHHANETRASAAPADEVLIPSPRPTRKRSLVNGKAVVVFATLGLATGIAFGSGSSLTHVLTENWRSSTVHDALVAFSANSRKEQPPAPAATATADAPDIREIVHQLNAISRELASMQQNMSELATGQEQIRKAQEQQLAETQSQMSALQKQIGAKTTPDQRRSNRRETRYIWR